MIRKSKLEKLTDTCICSKQNKYFKKLTKCTFK